MMIAAEPADKLVPAEIYPPLDKTRVPVGTGAPFPALTATVTLSACAVVRLEEFGETVTVGVALVTVTLDEESLALK